jgi:trehalose monomycolate/heme transporter
VIGLVIAVIYGLSTDYEVFLVSRMVEARERGTWTADAIRIGTATTGRLITAAALVLVVVAGAFVFSDLVMMKYLAFGLVTALLLDATVVRMFLVPSVMKLLGDECWWAPRWMKRLQNRTWLDEIDLPDERKRSAVPEPEDEPEEATVGADAPVPSWGPLPRDPTHPAVDGSSQPGAAARVAKAARRANTPSRADTTPMPNVRTDGAGESPTTRISSAENPEKNVDGEARAPTQRTDGGDPDATTAIPTPRHQDPDVT